MSRNKFGLFGTDGQSAQMARSAFRKIKSPLGDAGGIAGAGLGMMLGGPIGALIGGAAGTFLSDFGVEEAIPFIAANTFGQITGKGDYTVGPQIVRTKKRKRSSTKIKMNSGSTVVQHRSFVSDVVCGATANAFTPLHFDINPGLITTFPWLAPIANNFEEYVIEGMVFEYRSTSSDSTGAGNTTLGQILMATEYNVAASPFSSKVEMENHFFGQSAKPSVNQLHAIECHPSTLPVDVLFTRDGPPPDNYDKRFYDLGRFTIAVDGVNQTNNKMGELWVTYQIRLSKPKINATSVLESKKWNNYHSSGTLLDFGSLVISQSGNMVATHSSSTLTFFNLDPESVYLFTFSSVIAAGTVTTNPTFTYGTPANWAGYNRLNNNSTFSISSVTGSNRYVNYQTLRTGVGVTTASISCTGGLLSLSTTQNVDISLVKVDSSF